MLGPLVSKVIRMNVKVIEVVKDGVTYYIGDDCLLSEKFLSPSILGAIDFAQEPNASELQKYLRLLRLPEDQIFSMMSCLVTSVRMVELHVAVTELSSSPARHPYTRQPFHN